MINKVDLASAENLQLLRTHAPDAIVVSARTGAGIDRLKEVIDSRLPRPEVEVRALVPYERGDLLDQVHRGGEFVTTEHTATGTRIVARVHPELAAEFEPYAEAGESSGAGDAR